MGAVHWGLAREGVSACVIDGPAVSIQGVLPETWGSVVASVLLVEDDEQVRVLAESILKDAGHSVVTATGIDGSQALLDGEQPVDVLFVDITLGNDPEAGLKTAQHARERRPHLPILYTTGLAVDDGMKALFVEPCQFMPKPYTAEQLKKSIAFLLMNANPRPRPDLSGSLGSPHPGT
jgi:two-component system cell cycle sensor histidine kinase/response regulator CckA